MALSILNQHFPTDISKMILEMKDKSEHYERFQKLIIPMQIKSIINYHEKLLQYLYQNHDQFYVYNIDYYIIKNMEHFSMDNSNCIGYILKILSYCDCCEKHTNNKPTGLFCNKNTYELYFDEEDDKKYIHFDEYNDEHEYQRTNNICKHNCLCRHISRGLLRSYHTIYNPSIFNSFIYHKRYELLFTLHIINNNIKYNFDRIKHLKIKTKEVMSEFNNMYYDEEYVISDVYFKYDLLEEQINYYENRNTSLFIEYDITRKSLEDHIDDYPEIPIEEKYKNIYGLVNV